MIAVDDGFADATASQKTLMNKFTIVYEDSAAKNLPDFEINFPPVWNGVKKRITNGNSRVEGSIDDQLGRENKLESRQVASRHKNSNLIKRILGIFYKKIVQKMVAKHLRKFEKSFTQYEELFKEWKETEENRINELEKYILDNGEALDTNEVNLLMETSNTIKGIAEELAPKFLHIVERLEELSQQFSEYESDLPNRYEYLAAKAERSFGGQIEELLDFSDYYRGLARWYDPDKKLSKVFDDVESLFKHLEVA